MVVLCRTVIRTDLDTVAVFHGNHIALHIAIRIHQRQAVANRISWRHNTPIFFLALSIQCPKR